jgi:hypothetical protein
MKLKTFTNKKSKDVLELLSVYFPQMNRWTEGENSSQCGKKRA